MAISTFGGASQSSTNNLITGVIGSPSLAPVGFSDPNYVDSGTAFNPSTYPSLATAYPSKFTGDNWRSINSPMMPAAMISTTYGTPVTGFVMNSQFYLLFSKGHIFKTSDGTLSSLAYYKQIQIGNSANIISANMVGANFYILYSTSQVLVFTEPTLTSTTLLSLSFQYIAYGNGVYVGVPSSGNVVYRSTDGVNFTSGNIPVSGGWSGFDYGNGTFLLTSTTGGASNLLNCASADGLTWSTKYCTATAPLSGMVKFNGTYFVVIASATVGYYSSNGSSWTASTNVSVVNPTYMGFCTNGTTFAHNSGGANAQVVSTTAGTSWVYKNALFTGSNVGTAQMMRAFGNSIVVVGMGTTTQWYVTASTDGLTTLPTPTPIYGAGINPNVFPPAAIGTTLVTTENTSGYNNPTTAQNYGYSTDGGNTWTVTTLPVSGVLWRGCFATPTKFIIWGTAITGTGITVLSSTDGVNWTTNVIPYVPNTATIGFNYGETLYFAVNQSMWITTNYGSTVVGSSLPVTLTTTTATIFVTPSGNLVIPITTSAGYYSTNGGLSWTSSSWAGVASSTIGAYCAGPKLIMVAIVISPNTYYMMSSDGGATWQQMTFPVAMSATAKSMFYSSGYYFVYMGNNAYYYTVDGLTWTPMTTGTTATLSQPLSMGATSNGLPYLGGPGAYLLVGDNTSYHIPYIPSSVPGTKYVIRAQ